MIITVNFFNLKHRVIICLTLFLLTMHFAFGQSNPGTWTFTAKKISALEYEVRYSIDVESPWHVYSQYTSNGGPFPTTFTLAKNPLLTVKSKPKEIGLLKTKYEEVFDTDVKYFEGSVDFVQRVYLKSNSNTVLKGTVEFMLCNEGQCLPPTKQPFSIALR